MMDSQSNIDPLDEPLKGISFLVFGATIFSIQDVLIKYLCGQYPVFEIMFFRSLFTLLPMLAIVHFDSGLASLKTHRIRIHALRSLFSLIGYTSFYLGLAILPLADATALFFVSPIFVTVFSIILLHERVTRNRWSALFTGFTGMIIILRPGSGIVDPAAFLPIMAAMAYAATAPLTRQMADTESGSVMALYVMLFFLISSVIMGLLIGDGRFDGGTHASLSFFTRAWVFPPRLDLFLLLVMGLISACGGYSYCQAYRIAKSSTVAPFEYVAMIPAVMWGYLFWHEIPSLTTVIGMSLLICSGIYIIRRERHHATA